MTMTDEQYKELKKLVSENTKTNERIMTYLIGQEEFDQHGLVHRIADVEGHVRKSKKRQLKAEGARASIAVLAGLFGVKLKAIWHWIVELIST